MLRIILPVIPFILIALIFIWPNLSKAPYVPVMKGADNTIQGLSIIGENKDQSYAIDSKDVTEISEDEYLISNPSFALKDKNTSLTIKAKDALYSDHDQKVFHIQGNIHIKDKQGFSLKTEKVEANLRNNTVIIKSPLTAKKDNMTLTAGKADITRGGDKIVLKDSPTVTFK